MHIDMYENEEEQEGEEGSRLQQKTNAGFGLKMDDDDDDDDNDEIMPRGQRYSTITDPSDPLLSDTLSHMVTSMVVEWVRHPHHCFDRRCC